MDSSRRLCKPECLLDVQKLAGHVAALSRCILRLREKAMPLYKLLRNTSMFEWIEEADTTLAALKKVLVGPTLLAAPEAKEPMLMYIAVTNRVVNTVMVVKRPEKAESTPSSDPCITSARSSQS
jgi:hypothetical protein